jgi:hypothetical protein
MLAAAALLILLALGPAQARADYQQVPELYGQGGEAAQFGNALGAAVNETGEGGVAAGTLYVVGENNRVVRFSPGEEGEAPRFEEAWGWGIAEGGPEGEYVRCGPAYAGTASPAEGTYEHCLPANPHAPSGGEEPGHFNSLMGVAVDQATGDVYVRNYSGGTGNGPRKNHLIEVLTARGGLVGEGFGEAADGLTTPPQSIAATPGELHRALQEEGAIAVDEAGTVYLNDADYSGVAAARRRVMCFRPQSPGDYEHYVYCGEADDIAVEAPALKRIALAGGGRLAAATENVVREYAIEGGALLCSRSVAGQLKAMTADPTNGEVFYYTHSDESIHRLGPCDAGTGEFAQLQEARPAPATKRMYALAIDPARPWGELRPPGVLYAISAGNSLGQEGVGYVLAQAKLSLPPQVLSESVAAVGTDSASLEARVDPRGNRTTYAFEYLSEAAYAANGGSFEGPQAPARVPAGGGTIPGGAAVDVSGAAQGLSPDTAYRFRLVAESLCDGAGEPACEAAGEAVSFATYGPAPAGPPDGRAYELVSPPEKHGGEVFPADAGVKSCEWACKPSGTSNSQIFPMQSAPDGESVTYMGYAFSPTEGASVFNSYLSRRTSTGWRTAAMSPGLLGTKSSLHLSYAGDLGTDVISQKSPTLAPGAPEGMANLYLQDTAAPGTLTPLLTSPPPNRSASGLVVEYAGATPDASRQYLAANDALIHAVAGIGVLPDPTAGGANPGGRDLYEWHEGQLALVNVLPGNAAVAEGAEFASASPDAHGVAAGGRRVFFEAAGHLYVREDGQVTREVADPGSFLSASADGLRVLLSDGCLYSLLTESCEDLTQGHGGFLGLAGASEDLSRIYFADKAALAAAPEAGSCEVVNFAGPAKEEQEEGKVPAGYGCNLYLHESGAPTRFIATLLAGGGTGGDPADWAASSGSRTAEASPSGRYLAFASTVLRLTGYDNTGPCEKLGKGELVDSPCREAFLYDSATGRLTCPSCNPTGEAPRGPSTLRRIAGAKAWMPQPRYLTDSGRLYFDSQDRLSPGDVNGRVEDVYEAEPQGVGSCGRAGGCVSLISPGTGSVDSNLLAVDESGRDVFFTGRERLVRADTDQLIDLYDAREGGGFPGESEAAAGPCQGDACQGPAPAAPAVPAPGTPGYEGPGNPGPASHGCPKGKVRKGGKCVKKKHRKKHARHRHHKKGRNANHARRGGRG